MYSWPCRLPRREMTWREIYAMSNTSPWQHEHGGHKWRYLERDHARPPSQQVVRIRQQGSSKAAAISPFCCPFEPTSNRVKRISEMEIFFERAAARTMSPLTLAVAYDYDEMLGGFAVQWDLRRTSGINIVIVLSAPAQPPGFRLLFE